MNRKRKGKRLASIALLACASLAFFLRLPAQTTPIPDAPAPNRAPKPFNLPEQLPEKPSLAPAFSLPVEPLGFTAPAAFYLGQRHAFVSLDFLDEDHLLFTFRVPGLLHRQSGPGEEERQIRALVLRLVPSRSSSVATPRPPPVEQVGSVTASSPARVTTPSWPI